MYKLSRTSRKRLGTCDERIQRIVEEALKYSPVDFGVACGHRSQKTQQKAFKDGKSTLDGVKRKSRHQSYPSTAIDLYAYKNKALWDEESLSLLAGVILTTAKRLGIELEWGGHWKNFIDMPHFQLKK